MSDAKGSTPLDPPHEKYAQLLASGLHTTLECYQMAGFDGDRRAANRSKHSAGMHDRLAFLLAEAAAKTTGAVAERIRSDEETRAYVREQLERNIRIAMGDEPRRLRVKIGKGKTARYKVDEVLDPNAHAANRALHLLGMTVGVFEHENKPPPRDELLAPRSAEDPAVAEQLERYAKRRPRLVAIAGNKIP
jgi:hypothetical protein